jgi:hypothetical protein
MGQNGWTSHNEKLCQDIGNKCVVFKIMHNRCEEYYIGQAVKGKNILHFITFLGAILAVIGDYITDDWLIITSRIVAVMSAAVAKWYTSNNLNSNIKLHKLAASEYLQIYNDVTFVFSDIREARPDGREYTKVLLDKYNNLYNSSITVNRKIVDDFIRKYDDNDIARPIVAEEIKDIEIHHKDEQSDKSSGSSSNNTKKQPFKLFRMATNKDFSEGAHIDQPPLISEAYKQTPVDNISNVVINSNPQYLTPPSQRRIIEHILDEDTDSDKSVDLENIKLVNKNVAKLRRPSF